MYSTRLNGRDIFFSAHQLLTDQEHIMILNNLPESTNANGNKDSGWRLDIDYAVIAISHWQGIYSSD
ncbi:hypothetical protein L204_103685 [Cryptococcus depauperatus]